MKKAPLLLVMFLLMSSVVWAGEQRSSTVRRQFLARFGLTHTPPGCQVDHVVSLEHGGKDNLSNLCLICGDKLFVKEWAERRPDTLRYWLRDNRTWLKKKGCRYEWNTE